MFKVRGLNNRGSATVEMCFIMPIVLGVIVMLIHTFLSCKIQGETQCNEYTAIYVSSEEKVYGEVSDRLRRWQLYGDVVWE